MSLSENQAERLAREQSFHNEWARGIDLAELLVRESFESPTAIENRYALEALGSLKGKRVLEVGCGAAEASVYFALQGAEVTACDISEEFLKVAGSLADKFHVKINTSQADIAHLPYPDESFDFVFGNGVLHHVDLLPAAGQIRRVLKKGGKAVFIEPLPYNPVINVYRQMAKAVRTEDEKPLNFKQIHSLESIFSRVEHREFWLFSLLIFLHFYFFKRWHPSKVRYWKKVIEVGESYRTLFSFLQKCDHVALNCLPFLRPLCWNTVIVATK